MHGWRAVLASFGASTSLVLAGAMALAAISTVVAFQGWPGVEPQAASASSAVVAQARTATHGAATSPRVVVVAKARRPVAAHRRAAPGIAGTVVASTPVATNVSATPGRSGGSPTEGATSSFSAEPSVDAQKTPKQTSASAGDPIRKVGDGLGGGVQQTTKSLGDTVRPVSPALGNTLDNTGKALSNTVQKVTDTVGALLDALKPKHP
jgi:hypothetical protein